MKTAYLLERLKIVMAERNLSEEDVAAAIGVKPWTVHYWLAGEHMPRKRNIALLIGTFGLDRDVKPGSTPTAVLLSEHSQSRVEALLIEIRDELRRQNGTSSTLAARNELRAATQLLLEEAVAFSQQRAAE